MSGPRSNSGVRNLRAMFENNSQEGSASPSPSRGRSPAAGLSSTTSNGTTTPQPISKVRASFVSVEPNADIGEDLSRKTSGTRRDSFSMSEPSKAQEIKETIVEEKEKRRQSVDIKETIPESAIAPTPVLEIPQEEAMAEEKPGPVVPAEEIPSNGAELPVDDTPVANPDKPVTSAEDIEATLAPGDPTDAEAVSIGGAVQEIPTTESPKQTKDLSTPKKTPTSLDAPSPSSIVSTPSKSKPPKVVEVVKETASSIKSRALENKPTNTQPSSPKSHVTKDISQTKPALKPPFTKSGVDNSKKATAPAKTSALHPAPQSIRDKSPSRANTKSRTTTLPRPPTTERPSTSGSIGSLASQRSKHSSPNSKTRPKSPTRPVPLSAHLTAPTASSAAKHDAPKQGLMSSRSMGHLRNDNRRHSSVVTRSRTPNPQRSSETNGPSRRPVRASMATAGHSQDPPKPRPSTSGSSFLERMMRPTASSANKTHEKIEAKPAPRRAGTVKRPSTSGSDRPRRESFNHDETHRNGKVNDVAINESTIPEIPEVEEHPPQAAGAEDTSAAEILP